MHIKLSIEDYFHLKFKRKAHLVGRTIVLMNLCIHLIDNMLHLNSFQYVMVIIGSILLTLTLLPYFDIYILKDPLHTNTPNPKKYWVIAFYGDYKEIMDQLADDTKQAHQAYGIEKNKYDGKYSRASTLLDHTRKDPLEGIVEPPDITRKYKPNYRIIWTAAALAFGIDYLLPYFHQINILPYDIILNQGFRLIVSTIVIFSLLPVIEIILFKDPYGAKTMHGYKFWQFIWLGHMDLIIKQLATTLNYLNKKTTALKKASLELDALLDS